MTAIPKRTLTTMMNALASGVVPRRGLEYIAVGRRRETETFVSDLEDTSEGGGAFRFISGRYGNGKSFMIQMVRNYAMDRGFMVMDADLAINRRLTGSRGEGLNTYRELVRNMAVKARPDGGAMESLLQNWLYPIIDSEGDPEKVASAIRSATSGMSGMTFYRDFVTIIISYSRDLMDQRDDSPALRWLKGEYDLKSEARRDLGVSTLISDSNWYDYVKLWAELSVCAGYRGAVVFLDEAVVLYKLQNRSSRSNNYERLLTIFNDIITTSLRTCEGIDLNYISNKLGEDYKNNILENADRYIKEGLVKISNDHLKLTKDGIYVSDAIMSNLMIV